MQSNFRYLVYDIETVTDKALLQKVLYPEMEGDPEGAYQKHLAELADEGRDFINPSFHRSSASMIFDCRRYENARLISPGITGYTDSAITIIGSTVGSSSNAPWKRSWKAASPIFHSVSAGPMRTGPGDGTARRTIFSSPRTTLLKATLSSSRTYYRFCSIRDISSATESRCFWSIERAD